MIDTTTQTESGRPPHRRAFLKGMAVAGVTVPFAVACGGSDDAADTDTTTTPTGGGDTTATTAPTDGGSADVLTSAADVPVGGGVILEDADTVVTQPTKGTFAGFSAHCTHQGCVLANVAGGTINCTCHGSKFSITDGSVVNGPATSPLPKVTVKAEGSDIVAG